MSNLQKTLLEQKHYPQDAMQVPYMFGVNTYDFSSSHMCSQICMKRAKNICSYDISAEFENASLPNNGCHVRGVIFPNMENYNSCERF